MPPTTSAGVGICPSRSAAETIATTGASSVHGTTAAEGLRASRVFQIEYPTIVHSTDVYSVETADCHPKAAIPAAIACGPSTTSDIASAGTGTTSADHTVSESAPSRPGPAHHPGPA